MPYAHHPDIPAAPADETAIWQYLSVAELLDLLDSSALHLTRADKLTDPSIDVESQVFFGVLSGIPAETIRRSFDLMQSVQTAVFASCWYASGSAVHRRWEECGGGKSQIAIRSTAQALQAAISHVPHRIYLSAVQYMDFAASRIPTGNVFLPALHKCQELRDEKEVRLLMLQTGGQKAFSPGPSQGVDLTVDLGSLIQGLRLAPRTAEWLRDLVGLLADRHGITYEVCTADLSAIGEKQVCRFESANGSGSSNHSFATAESLHDASLAEQLGT